MDDIERIIDQMKKYQEKLEGVEKMNYEIFSKETIDLLHNLIEEKKRE